MLELATTCKTWKIPPSYYLADSTTLDKYAFDTIVAQFINNIEAEIYPVGYEDDFIRAAEEAEKRFDPEEQKKRKNKNVDMNKIL